jgi:hypothetical protein
MVDLTRICAAQPTVFTDDASARVAAVDLNELRALAELSLPLLGPEPQNAQFDETRQAWLFSASNPNLRVAGSWERFSPNDISASWCSVSVVHTGRGLHLPPADGYHRAIGLRAAG